MRVEPYMDKLISTCQSSFVKTRNIMQSVLTLNEVLHESRRKKTQRVVLKLDFEKAYDKVDWCYLMKCLKRKGFSERWQKWIKLIVQGGTLCVKINNTCGPYFGSFRGVR